MTSRSIADKTPSSPSSSFETYQRTPSPNGGDDPTRTPLHQDGDQGRNATANRVLVNFILMSIFFSANHGCVVACLGLATARLGSVGAWQSGILYLTYTGSALFGATFFVKRLGPRDALILGMIFYCFYVGAFWWAAGAYAKFAALTGAAIGGVGAGFLWTAQGSFFARSAEEHARALGQPSTVSTARLAGIFACLYLGMEVALRSLSSVLLEITAGVGWTTIFALYALITVLSTVMMIFVQPPAEEEGTRDDIADVHHSSSWYEVTAALQLLRRDAKIRYMIGLNALFGFASAFLNSYVNGEVVSVVLNDEKDKYLGLLTAWVSIVAAVMSLVFGRVASDNKGLILTAGALCFSLVALPFILFPDIEHQWNPVLLLAVYTLHGVGRSTFEGSLKATFADMFPQEREGAFANIILQNGLASAIGYVMSFALTCRNGANGCAQYRDGSLHNVRVLEWMVVGTAIVAVWGYWKADVLHRQRDEWNRSVWTLVENQDMSVV